MRLIDAEEFEEPFYKQIELGANGFEAAEDALHDTPTVDAVPVVRCKDCIYYKKRHVLTNDGQEKSYEEMPKQAFGGLNFMCVTAQYGINVGGTCTLDCVRGYLDESVFRGENDFCLYGRKDACAQKGRKAE